MKSISAVVLVTLVAGMLLLPLGVGAEPGNEVTPLPAVDNAGGRLGAVAAFEVSDLAQRAGVGWERVNFWWNQLQPEAPDQWDWSGVPLDDAQLSAEVAAGIGVVGLLGNPPAWATRNGSVPKNLTLPIGDPANYWARFVSVLARRYAGRINYWIIWNEPDIDAGQPGSTWGGLEEEYYYLVKTASLAAKAANPDAKIVFAGTTYFADFNIGRQLFLERVLTAAGKQDPAAAANGYYFDVVNVHVYGAIHEMENVPQKNREVLRRFGLDKPIWIGEANVVPWDDPVSPLPRGHFRATLEEQASFIIEAFALAMAAGVERFEVYKMRDGEIERHEPYGFVRNDRSLRPAFVAYQVAAKYLDRPAKVRHRLEGDIHLVTFERPDARVTVLWNGAPAPGGTTVIPVGTRVLLLDKYGKETFVNPRQAGYWIPLAPATANTMDGQPNLYIIGGDPRILIEEGLSEALTDVNNSLYFPLTGYHVEGNFLDYFKKRGGLRSFGFPISRRFILLGSEVQFFQRQVMQVRPGGSVGTLNILDADLMPYTPINGAALPAIDKTMQTAAPVPGTPNYAVKALQFVDQRVPNVWETQPVSFLQTFNSTVKPEEAFPAGGRTQLNLLPGINLELWGLPTSLPARDPANANFVFQRFQRGVLHFDRGTGLTQGVLLAAYLHAIITGRELPPDVAAGAKDSRFYLQYDNDKPNGLRRPEQLPATHLKDAFEREALGWIPPLKRP